MDIDSIQFHMPTIMAISVIASSAVALILSIALSAQKDNRLANRILALVILFSLSNQILLVLKAWNIAFSISLLIRLDFPVFLLCCSLLYFYFRITTRPEQTLSTRDCWHLVPSALGLAWYVLLLLFGGDDFFTDNAVYRWERQGRDTISVVVSAFYLLMCQRLLVQFKAKLPTLVSHQDDVSILWLRLILSAVLLIWVVSLANVVAGPYVDLWHWKPVVSLLCLSVIACFAIKNSAVFNEVKKLNVHEKSTSLPQERLQRLVLELNKLFVEQRPYLDPNLRLSGLADLMHLKPYQMSEVIGRGLGTTFFDFVNQHRVDEVKRRLVDPKLAHLSILGIAMDSGFNSKSAFAETFKRWTGVTPSAFRTTTHKPS